MPRYAIDSNNQPMTGTGIVEPVMEWEETPDGKRRPSQTQQQRNEDTGMPLWQVEVLYIQSSFGRLSTVTAKVQVEAPEEPKLAPLTPIRFSKLEVEVRTNKAGGFSEYWSAEGITEAQAPKAPARPSGDKAA